MLPTLDLQFSDIVTFTMDINTPVQLPPTETALKPEFAELLQLKFDAASEEGLPVGQNLPRGGSQSPPGAEFSIPGTSIDAHPIGQDLPGGGSQLPPGVELSVPAASIDLETDTDADFALAQAQIDVVAVAAPALSVAASTSLSQSQVAPVQTAATAAHANLENMAKGDSSVSVASLPLVTPAKSATEPRTGLHLESEGLRDTARKPVDPAALIVPRETGSQAQTPVAALPVVTSSAPMSRQERETAVARENSNPLLAKIVPGTQENNAIFEQRYPTRTSLPDTTPAGLAPPVVAPRSRIVGVPEQKLSGQMKLSRAATQAANLLSQSGPVQFTHSPIQSIPEPSVSLSPSSTSQVIAMPVQMEAWGEKISERILLMAGSQLKSANIRLTPAELGPLHVRVSMDDGAASVAFNAQHATTREALEMALPRLRDMLAENGITLGQTSIGDQGVSQGKRDGQTDAPTDTLQTNNEADDNTSADTSRQHRGSSARNGLVDTFA